MIFSTFILENFAEEIFEILFKLKICQTMFLNPIYIFKNWIFETIICYAIVNIAAMYLQRRRISP